MFFVRIYIKICARVKPKTFFCYIFKNKHFRRYVASQVLYKCINVAIENILNGQINFYDSLRPNFRKSSKFVHRMKTKPVFLAVSSKISILGDMLLHKFDINVVIANILVYGNCLYDLSGPKCKNLSNRQTLEKGVAHNALIASSKKMQ